MMSAVAVSLRRAPQPFKGLILYWALTVVVELIVAMAGLGSVAANTTLALFGSGLLLIGLTLVLNLNGCADYMRDQIRKDAPYGFDYYRYALAEGPGGVRVPGATLLVAGVAVTIYSIARL